MSDIISKARAERLYKKSVQEMMDEKMCRPGYRWYGEPLNRCLPAAVPSDYRPDTPEPDVPPPTEDPAPNPDASITAEMKKRQGKK